MNDNHRSKAPTQQNLASRVANPSLEATVLATAVQSTAVAGEVCRLSEDAFSTDAHQRIYRAVKVVMTDTAYEAISVQLIEGVLKEPFPLELDRAVDDAQGVVMVRQLDRISWSSELLTVMSAQVPKLGDATNPDLQHEVYDALSSLRRPPGSSVVPNIESFDPTMVGSTDPKRRWVPSGFRQWDAQRAWRDKGGHWHIGGPSERTVIGIGGESGSGKTRTTLELAMRLSVNYTLKYDTPAPIWAASGEMGRREVLDAIGANPAVASHRWTRAFNELGINNPLFIVSKEDAGAMDIDDLIGYFVDQVERIVHQGLARRETSDEILARLPRQFVIDYPALYLPTGKSRVEALSYATLRIKELVLKAPFNLQKYPVLRDWGAIALAPFQIKGAKELMQRGEYQLPTRDSVTWARDIVDHLDEFIIIARDPAAIGNDGKLDASSDRRLLVVDKVRHGTPLPEGLPMRFIQGQLVEHPDQKGRPYTGPGPSELTDGELGQLDRH